MAHRPDERAGVPPEQDHAGTRHPLASALPLGVCYVRADGRLEFCNRPFRALYGTRALEGRPIIDVLGESGYRRLREHMREALSGTTVRYEGELAFPSVGTRFLAVLLAPDRERPGGEVRGVYLLLDDRTDLEAARRALRAAVTQAALAEERERRALAADLHDDAGQLLALATMKLRELRERTAETAWTGAVEEVAGLVRDVRERIASLSFQISPPLLYDLGLSAALEWFGERLRDDYGLEVAVETAPPELPGLDEATRVTVFRALRELLINVAKHAETRRCKVALRSAEDEFVAVVEDHGHGFEPGGHARGFGLKSVLDRIASLGGRVEVESAPGRGTRITLRVPLAREPAR